MLKNTEYSAMDDKARQEQQAAAQAAIAAKGEGHGHGEACLGRREGGGAPCSFPP